MHCGYQYSPGQNIKHNILIEVTEDRNGAIKQCFADSRSTMCPDVPSAITVCDYSTEQDTMCSVRCLPLLFHGQV